MTGLTSSIAATITQILTGGGSSEVIVDKHQFLRPNEGIRRSARNAVLVTCVFGPIAGIASGLVASLVFKLSGVEGWFILGIDLTITFTITYIINFLIHYGGIAYIQHYVLRWQLWRAGYIPQNYIDFLDYATERILLCKIGGGYMFTHHLLLEYFANLR